MEELGPGKITVVIPTFNEAEQLPRLLHYLHSVQKKECIKEVIICDGGSNDATSQVASSLGAMVIDCSVRQRAAQMNCGASIATGDVLYFLHADSYPPLGIVDLIQKELQAGNQSGCFRLKFDLNHWFLQANAWFTRFTFSGFHYGDQSLFITKNLFQLIGGFEESLFLMEDQEIISRVKKAGTFVVIPAYITTSARKYQLNGVFRLQFIFYTIFLLYVLGFSQQTLKSLYKKWIR